MKKYFLSVTVLLPSFVLAEGAAPLPSPGLAFAKVIFVLGFIVAFILFSAWLARRSGFINVVHKKNFQVVASVALGQKEKAVLLKVGKQNFLLGVAAGGVNTLHAWPENENPLEQEGADSSSSLPKPGVDFSTHIKKLLTQGQAK
jgi:flagellar protein FliO/FliZ